MTQAKNAVLTDNNGNVVTIGCTVFEEIWNNDMNLIKLPITLNTESSGITTKIINLLKAIRSFNIDGFISACGNDSTGNFGGTDTLEQQRTKLRNMVNGVRNVTLTYGTIITALSGGMSKLSMRDTSNDNDGTNNIIEVKILFISGQNYLTG